MGHLWRPVRKHRVRLVEIADDVCLGIPPKQGPKDQQDEPGGRHQVGHRSLKEIKARNRVQTACAQEPQVLQVAPAPALIAQGIVDQVAWGFLKAARHAGQEPHTPARPAQETRLDEIVAEDQFVTEEARDAGQPGGGGKGACPDDGVVTPIISFGLRPMRQPLGQKPAIGPVRKLLKAGENRLGRNKLWIGLDQAGLRVGRHFAGQPMNAAA